MQEAWGVCVHAEREAQCTKIVVTGMETQPEKSKEVFWVCGALWYCSGSRDAVLKA